MFQVPFPSAFREISVTFDLFLITFDLFLLTPFPKKGRVGKPPEINSSAKLLLAGSQERLGRPAGEQLQLTWLG